MKINPYFEVEGKKYEIERNRAIECQFEKIREQNKLDDDKLSLVTDYKKLVNEYQEILEKYEDVKNDYFDNVLDKDKKEKYKAFKELSDEKFNELKEFELKNKNLSLDELRNLTYKNGVELLVYALSEKYKISQDEAKNIWEKFVEHFGIETAKEWIELMIQTLFEKDDEEEENPFLKQAKAKAKLKMEQRKGLSKIKK